MTALMWRGRRSEGNPPASCTPAGIDEVDPAHYALTEATRESISIASAGIAVPSNQIGSSLHHRMPSAHVQWRSLSGTQCYWSSQWSNDGSASRSAGSASIARHKQTGDCQSRILSPRRRSH